MRPKTQLDRIREAYGAALLPVVYAGPAQVVLSGQGREVMTFVTADMRERPEIRLLGGLIRKARRPPDFLAMKFHALEGGGIILGVGLEQPVLTYFWVEILFPEWPGFFASLSETGILALLPADQGPKRPGDYVLLSGDELRIEVNVKEIANQVATWRALGPG